MVKSHSNATHFLADCQTLLEEKEAANNLILGLAGVLKQDIYYYGKNQPLLVTLHIENQCVGACLQTPPNNLILYFNPDFLESAIQEVVHYLMEMKAELPGIIGPKDAVLKFAHTWTTLTSLSYRVARNEMVYQLNRVSKIRVSPGQMRQAIGLDQHLVANWTEKFYFEAIQSISSKEAIELASKKIREGSFYLWETDEPVSMAAWTRPTKNGVTIAYVYTPPEQRGKGYASNCVAQLSQLMLEKYQFCTLFTDLSNPISNSIYQKMGYQPIEYFLQCKFFKE